MQTYKVGTGNQQVQLTVDVDTIGLAATRARLIVVQSPDPGVTVATSSDATGDIIPRKDIGARNAVASRRLSVFTKIDLLGDLAERKAEAERLTAAYTLEGGDDGKKSNYAATKKNNSQYTSVSLTLLVDLNA